MLNLSGVRRGAAAFVVSVVVTGCAGSGSEPGAGVPSPAPDSTVGPGPAPVAAAGWSGWEPPACDRPVDEPPTATPTPEAPSEIDLVSFDGTRLRIHWFPVDDSADAAPAPTVLMGPGWGMAGDTDVDTVGVLGAMDIANLRAQGFNVLTWDPRGFGASDGVAQVDSAEFEGRDVGRLLDWVAAQPGVELDRAGDPRVGMIGGSYGGGIQLVTAAIDCRVDAIVPVMAWQSLETSLYRGGIAKLGWANILTRVAAAKPLDEHLLRASEDANSRGVISEADIGWFVDRGPGASVGRIGAPTLLVQGTVDTLFSLDEGVANYRLLRDAGVPVAMLWYCGGHGTCLTNDDDGGRLTDAAMAWLLYWVAGDRDVTLPAVIDVVDQHGEVYRADDYPLPAGAPLDAEGSGTLELTAGGGAGPVTPPEGAADLLRSLVVGITPARADHAVEVAIPAPDDPVLVVGAPELSVRYSGTTPDGERPVRVFAQLVDLDAGLTVGNQITPVELTLDGASHELVVPLETVAVAIGPDSRFALQLVATTVAYAEPRLGGSVTFDRVALRLPVADGFTPSSRG